jgi:hypothetical protein
MNDPAPPKVSKISRLSELRRDIPPPHDGWPALEAKLRESGMEQTRTAAEQAGQVRRWRPRMVHVASLAAVLAAVVVGISIDRWILSPAPLGAPVAAVPGNGGAERGIPVTYVTDPRYLRERAELLRSLNAKLAKLPPASRQKVLNSLATIHQSIQDIQQALGREPGNALLQELLIDSYQNEMQVLATVQEASGAGGET